MQGRYGRSVLNPNKIVHIIPLYYSSVYYKFAQQQLRHQVGLSVDIVIVIEVTCYFYERRRGRYIYTIDC
jgi:hypothetical protein